MTRLNCDVVLHHLGAFHDGELPVEDRVAVAGHLQTCPMCQVEADRLGRIGAALKEGAGGSPTPDFSVLGAMIVSRLQAEHDESLSARVGRMFEDMHFVWAGLSATMATVTCAGLLFGILFLAPPERADSLAGLLGALAAPGSDRNPVSLDHRMDLPRFSADDVVPAMMASETTEGDLVLALAAVVTREGRVARSELLSVNRDDREAALRLMNALNDARFKPASLRGNPVAVNLVWLVTHTTVRGKAHS